MIFNYVIIVALSITVSLSQFQTLESDNLGYPIYIDEIYGDIENRNLYFYNINDYGINSKQDDYIIGIWVNLIQYYYLPYSNFIMQINQNTVNVIYYQESIKIYCSSIEGEYYRSPFVYSWIYLFYKQNVILGNQQICYIQIYYGPSPTCVTLPSSDYYQFGFLQLSQSTFDYLWNYYFIYLFPYFGEAISITIKKMVLSESPFFQMNDLITLMSYVEPEVLLDLKIYERYQTKILKDWSSYQRIVQLGNSLNYDEWDPQINTIENLISFQNQQYIQIENFRISKSITIEFQLFSNLVFDDELILFTLKSRNQSQDSIRISANIQNSMIQIQFPNFELDSYCSIDFQQKIVLGIVNLALKTYILFIQKETIILQDIFLYEIFDADTDILYIGSFNNQNIDPFYLSSIRISNGFYSPYQYINDEICTYSIDQCIYCFNGYYLFQGQCVISCPQYYVPNDKRQECIPKCHPTCLDCDELTPTICLSCAGNRFDEPSCKCPPGYFDDGISPDCIKYLPDVSIDIGISEFYCYKPSDNTYLITFKKNYLSPPSVAINLLGHLDYNAQREFQVFVDKVFNTQFYLRVICSSYQVVMKIQWVAGKSSSFLNVIQTDYSGAITPVILSSTPNISASGGILGWCLQNLFFQNTIIDLNLEKINYNQFQFSSNQDLYLLKYQFFEYANYIYYSFNEAFNLEFQNQQFSIGGATIQSYIEPIPLSIPTLLQIRRLKTSGSSIPQFYITQKRRPGQVEFKMKTFGYTTMEYFTADLIFLAVSCYDPYKSCDYIKELQKCNLILSQCQCSSSQYMDLKYNVCVDCDPNCLTCENYYSNCSSCYIESKKELILDYYNGYNYCDCKISQYQDFDGICQDCDPNCYQCYYMPTFCLSCKYITQFLNDYNQCECIQGYLQTENGCELCQLPCLTCESTLTNCLSCQYIGQVLPTCQCPTGQKVVDGQCIQYCPTLCLDCDNQTQCNTCVSLSSYNFTLNICQCQEGYFNNNIECQICQSPCVNCISLTQCTSCINLTYYVDVTCQQCVSPCLECTSLDICLSCTNDSYYLSNNICVLCESPCLTCKDQISCKSCINETYYLDLSTLNCILCVPPCYTCDSVEFCHSCINDNYYLSSFNRCLNCISPCLTCISETQCTNCVFGYYMDENLVCQPCVSPCIYCSAVDICILCQAGYYLDGNYMCQLCQQPCLTCTVSSVNCVSCIDSTMIIISGNCNCASNQYYDSITQICQNCHPTCTACSNLDNCCFASQFLQLNRSTNSCECQNGYYFALDTCQICNPPCLQCSSSSVCTSCIDGYYLSSPSCLMCTPPCQNCMNTSTECLSCVSIDMVVNNQTCICPSKYYMNIDQTDCIQCHSTCQSCVDSNNCCYSIEHKILDSNNDVCKCIDGYFESDGMCQQCNRNCLTCEINSTKCLSCETKFILNLQLSECLCRDSHQFINDLNLCENCSSNCLSCSINAINCLSCDETKKLQLIQGVCQCKTNEYLNENGICTQCHSTCNSCVNGTNIGCLSCTSSRKMNPENKLCECSEGYFSNDANECIKCSSKCGKCLNDHECLTCSENRSLDQDNVSCNCNNGYFENSKQVCQKCSPPCATCSSSSDCLSCLDVNRRVIDSRCQCQIGYFENEQKLCESCSTINGKVNDICNYVNCGDGELTKGEQCDDGNTNSRDGCSDCKIDSLFTCVNKLLSRSICFKCVTNCQTCSLKGYKSSCDKCYDGYFLKDDECLKCQDSCYTCKDNKTCLSCNIIDAKPDEKGACPKCTNVKGYYIVNRKCITRCGDAILVENEICDDGNSLDGDGCNSQCQVEKYYSCKDSICTKIPQPNVDATYANSTTSDSMILNFPIDQGDPCTKINITIDSFQPTEFQSFIKYEQFDDSTSKCNIDFSFNKTIDVGNLIHIFIPVKVRTSRRILEEETREIIITPRKKIVYSQSQVQQAESASDAQSTLGDMLYFIAPTAIVLGGFNFFWTIMDILSWINNLYYINIYFPENVRMFFQKSAWGDFQLFPAFFVLNEPNDPYYIESPKKFMEKGVDPIFLNNTWTCFAIIGITICIYFFSYFLLFILEFIWPPIQVKAQSQIKIFQLNDCNNNSNDYNFNSQIKFTKNKMKEPKSQLKVYNVVNQKKRFPYLIDKIYQPLYKFKINFYSNLIKSLNLAFLDLVLAIILQITTIPSSLMDYQIVFINQILSYVSISICLLTLTVSYYVTTKHHLLLDNEIFQNQFGTLYESINTKSSTAMMYSFINLNRKALFIIVVVYFYYQPLLQTVFSCFISFLNIALIIYENPFISNADLIQNGVPDFCIFVLMLLSTGFALDDIIGLLNADQRFQIGWLMIGTIGLSIFIQVVFLLREFVRDLQEKYQMVSEKIQKCLKSRQNQ